MDCLPSGICFLSRGTPAPLYSKTRTMVTREEDNLQNQSDLAEQRPYVLLYIVYAVSKSEYSETVYCGVAVEALWKTTDFMNDTL